MSYAICIATHILLMQKQLNATTVLSCSKLLYRKMLLQPLLNDAIIVSSNLSDRLARNVGQLIALQEKDFDTRQFVPSATKLRKR